MEVDVRAYLAATDLDLLLILRQRLTDDALSQADRTEIANVLDKWTDVQAISNLLMYPQLIPGDHRIAVLQRGLRDEHPYLRLAAVVGLSGLNPAQLGEQERHRFLQLLVGLIRTDGVTCAERASCALVPLLRASDAPDLVGSLTHPSQRVRHNLLQGLLGVAGTSGLADLLDANSVIAAEADGIDLSAPADQQRRPLILAYVPSYPDFDPAR